MHGISKAKHKQLTNALLELQRLLKGSDQQSEDLKVAVEYREELTVMYTNYERLLQDLEVQINAYDSLFNHVKVQYLGKKLKELKKTIPAEKPAYRLLTENIRLAYGT